MSHSEKKAEFLSRIDDCAGLIHKKAAIYTDRKEDGEDLMQKILYRIVWTGECLTGDYPDSLYLYYTDHLEPVLV